MAASPYFAKYCTFQTPDKTAGAYLLSADSLVGDLFDITFDNVDGKHAACLQNRFGHMVGYFDHVTTHKLMLCQADGWELHAILSAVFFSEDEDSGYYWGEAAIICFSKRHSSEFTAFMEGICKQLRGGKRPAIELRDQGVKAVLDSKGNWTPKDREPKRKMQPGTVVVKDYLKHDERLVEMARNRNVGCMIVGWAFIIAIIALAAWFVWSILPF